MHSLAEETLLKGCVKTQKIINVENATNEDYHTEYLANILNIKVVDGVDEAISHIIEYAL